MNAPGIKFPLYETGHHRLTPDERAEFNAQFDVICNSGQFRNGQWSTTLSRKLSEMTGYKYAIPTDSGTSALAIIAAWVNSIRRLSRVLVPRYTFQATYNALAQVLPNACLTDGLIWPDRFDPKYSNLIMSRYVAENSLTMEPHVDEIKAVDAVVTVGLGGQHCDFDSPDVLVIEDCCQDWITKPHTGNHRAISFDPSKVVSGLDGGGAILTDSAELAEWASRVISNGLQTGKDISPAFGKRSITEVNALHVLMMLLSVKERLNDRRNILSFYKERFGSFFVGTDFSNHDASKALLWLPHFDWRERSEIMDLQTQQSLADYRLVYDRKENGEELGGVILSLPLSERKGVHPQMNEWIDPLVVLLKKLEADRRESDERLTRRY